MQIYSFNKSLEERYLEYQNILLDCRGHEMQFTWGSYMANLIEPAGWDGDWYIPPHMCKTFNLLYPETVLVNVHCIDFARHTATVEVKEDIQGLPDIISDVSLSELHPRFDQDPRIALPHMDLTAECLDQYRVFFKNLWFPWDEEEEDVIWAEVYLLERLKLYYEMVEGRLSFETGILIKDLIIEAKALYKKVETLGYSDNEDPETIYNGMDLSSKFEALKKKLQYYTFADYRRKLEQYNRSIVTHDWKHCLVLKDVTPSDIIDKIHEITVTKILPGDVPLHRGTDLNETIKLITAGDSLVLGPGTYPFASAGALELGGSFLGATLSTDMTDLPVLEDVGYERYSWLQFTINKMIISNVHFKVDHKFAITVCKNATLVLNNVKISGNAIENGLCLKGGSSVLAKDCVFEDLNVVFRLFPLSKLVLENCTFKNNTSVISTRNNTSITMNNCSISGCTAAAIICRDQSISFTGPVDCLNQVEGFKIESCNFENNKHDAQIISNTIPIVAPESDLD